MSITDKINCLVKARWNPGEDLWLSEMYDIARPEGITKSDSTVRRTMQDLGRLGTISFYRDGKRGCYTRLPVGIERSNDCTAIAKQAALSATNELINHETARKMTAERVLRLLNLEEPDATLVEDIEQIESHSSDETERWSQVRTRIGQGEFRRKLITYWEGCAVAGCKLIKILRASHIKPWRLSSDVERLDLYNGLLLLPSIDSLFDAGLITFDLEGSLNKSVFFEFFDNGYFGIPDDASIAIEEKHHQFLEYHRNEVFTG